MILQPIPAGLHLKAELLHGFYLGNFLVDPLKRQVTGPKNSVQITPKAAEVMLQLAASPNSLVTREFLLEKVWGEGRGSNEALAKVVREIRSALADPVDDPQLLQTLPGRGYRLIVEPQPAEANTDSIVLGGGKGVDELGLFDSLQQRGVFEAALAYLVLGWLLIQIADVVFAQLLLPQWAGTFVTVLVIAGFPIVLALSWLLEFRDGKASVDRGPDARHPRRRFSRAYLAVVGALGISGVLVFAYDRTVGLPESADEVLVSTMPEAGLPPVSPNSIAVLKFLNIDGSDATAVFASGLAEGMISRLARLPSILVASRGDAWSLGSSASSKDVRRRLRVAYFVEGSVQLVDDRLLVSINLIDSESGFQLTTRSFDEPIQNFNQVQRELIDVTVANLRVALPPETEAVLEALDEEADLDAYILYRKGREVFERPQTIDSISEAIGLYEQALTFDADYAAAHAGLCRSYVALYDLSGSSDDIDTAESACAAALRASSRLPVVYTALGSLYFNTGRLEAAEDAFDKALEIDPQDVSAMSGLAEVYQRTQRPARAEILLADAIGRQPGNWRTINSMGRFLFSQGRYRDAADAWSQVVLLNPENFQVRSNLGTVLLLAGKFEEGRKVMEEALAIQPNEGTYSNLGVVYYYLGDYADAVATYRQAVELAPGRAINWLNLGDALFFAGETDASKTAFEEARELVDSALEVNPSDSEALVTRAWTKHHLGDARGALLDVDKALEIDPDDPYSYYYEALIRYRSGDEGGAMDALEQAVKRGFPANFLVAEPYLGDLRSRARFHTMVAESYQ